MEPPLPHYPVTLWVVLPLFMAELYLMVFPSIVRSAVTTMSFPGDRWQVINFFIAAQYYGTLIAVFIAPFVDNYLIHSRVSLIAMSLSTIVTLICCGFYFIRPIEALKATILFECFVSIAHPFFFVKCSTLLRELKHPRPKAIFVGLISASKIMVSLGQLFQLWYPVHMSTLPLRVIFMSIPILFVLLIVVLSEIRSFPIKSEKGDTFRAIACMVRAVFRIPTGFESMLTHYSYKTVNDAKKTAKIFMVLGALSLNLSLLNILDLPWMFQYTSSIRQGFSQWVDFTSTAMLLSALFIPVVEFVVMPCLAQISSVPVLANSIALGCTFSILSIGISMGVQSKADDVNFRRMDAGSVRVFLYNAMDSLTYVLTEGTTKTLIPAASIQAFTLSLQSSHLPITLWVINIHTNVRYKMILHLKPMSSTAFVMTERGHYQIPSVGLVRKSSVAPGSLSHPTLFFLCPTDLDVGDFFPWCNATVTVHSQMTGYREDFNLLQNGNGSSAELVDHEWGRTSVNIVFNSPGFAVDEESIEFQSVQGGKYVLFVWASHHRLKIKYRIIQVLSPFTYPFYLAFPQIVFRALAIAFTEVSIFSLVQINVVSAFVSTTWAFVFLSQLLYFPIFVAFLALEMREWTYQVIFAIVNAFNIITVLLAMRIARYT